MENEWHNDNYLHYRNTDGSTIVNSVDPINIKISSRDAVEINDMTTEGVVEATLLSTSKNTTTHRNRSSTLSTTTSTSATQDGNKHRSVTWVQLTFIAYSFTAAGPFGIEAAVQACGPLLTIIGLILTPVLYVLPQIIVVAEMATMMPTSHGSVLWVQRAFGNGVGFFNSMTSVITGLIDAAVYPTLFATYMKILIGQPNLAYWPTVGLAFGCIVIGFFLSLLSARAVGHAVTILSFLVMLPFLVGVIAGWKFVSWEKITELDPIYNEKKEYDYGLLLSTMVWLFTGWRSMGSLGGEVAHPFDFLKGMPLALFLGTVSYIFPLCVALSVPPPMHLKQKPWTGGYIATAFGAVLPGLEKVIAAAGACGNVGLFSSSMLCYPRTMWGVAERGWLPKFLAKRSSKTHSPYNAVILYFFSSSILILLDFSVLVRAETIVSAAGYILSMVCLVRLRYLEPDTPRPIRIPKSNIGSMFLVGFPSLLFFTMFATNFFNGWLITTIAVGADVLVIIAYFTQKWWKRKKAERRNMNRKVVGIHHHHHHHDKEKESSGPEREPLLLKHEEEAVKEEEDQRLYARLQKATTSKQQQEEQNETRPSSRSSSSASTASIEEREDQGEAVMVECEEDGMLAFVSSPLLLTSGAQHQHHTAGELRKEQRESAE